MARVLGVLVVLLLPWALTATAAVAEGRWQALENNPSCVVWNAYPLPNETVAWSGACANGKAQGRGTQVKQVFIGGTWLTVKYEGEMKDGKEHGRGARTSANGDKCEGDWRENRLFGTGKGRENGQFKKCYMDGNTIKYID